MVSSFEAAAAHGVG